jgi:hypothetical protein
MPVWCVWMSYNSRITFSTKLLRYSYEWGGGYTAYLSSAKGIVRWDCMLYGSVYFFEQQVDGNRPLFASRNGWTYISNSGILCKLLWVRVTIGAGYENINVRVTAVCKCIVYNLKKMLSFNVWQVWFSLFVWITRCVWHKPQSISWL